MSLLLKRKAPWRGARPPSFVPIQLAGATRASLRAASSSVARRAILAPPAARRLLDQRELSDHRGQGLRFDRARRFGLPRERACDQQAPTAKATPNFRIVPLSASA